MMWTVVAAVVVMMYRWRIEEAEWSRGSDQADVVHMDIDGGGDGKE